MYIQYQNAPNFTELLAELGLYLTIPIEDFFSHYFNLATADTQGLANWGVILNQPNNIITNNYIGSFGFDTGVPPSPIDTGYPQNFNNGNFSVTLTPTQLTNNQYRILLQMLYSTYTTNCSVQSCMNIVNNYIQNEYSNTSMKCIIIEGNMSFIYSFNFTLQPFEITIFDDNKKLPRPGGIDYSVIWI